MDTNDFKAAVQEMIAGLEAHPAITVDTQRIGGPLKGSLSVEVPEAVRAYYEAIDGFEVSWRIDPAVAKPLVEIAGQAPLHPITIKFPSLAEILAKPGLRNAQDEDARDSLVVLCPSGYEIHVGLLVEDGALGDKMHSYSFFDDSLMDLGGTIGDYIEACLQARGIGSWGNCWGSFDRADYADFDFAKVVRSLFGDDAPFTAYEVAVWSSDDDDDDEDDDNE